MGNRAPEDLGIGHPWELNVARVNRLTGDLFYTVDPVRIFPGNVITLRRFHQWKLRCGRRGALAPWLMALLPNLRTVFFGKV